MRYALIGVCVFAAACSGESRSGPTSASSAPAGLSASEAKNGSALPFKGNLEATEAVEGELHHVVGTGEATHLGRFTFTAEVVVDGHTGQGLGTATWTAANGDRICASLTGVGVLDFPTVAVTETEEITGGTGRFSGASGTIVLERVVNLLTSTTTGVFTGTINLGH